MLCYRPGCGREIPAARLKFNPTTTLYCSNQCSQACIDSRRKNRSERILGLQEADRRRKQRLKVARKAAKEAWLASSEYAVVLQERRRARAAYMRHYYATHPWNAQKCRERTKKRVQQLKHWFREHKAQLRCQVCGEDDIACLDFHHRDPSTKQTPRGGVSQVIHQGWSIKRLEEEMAKCDVLCANHHRKLHRGRWTAMLSE